MYSIPFFGSIGQHGTFEKAQFIKTIICNIFSLKNSQLYLWERCIANVLDYGSARWLW